MKLVILDCDGTLVDSQNGICAAMDHAFAGLGLTAPSRAATLAIVGLSLPEAFAALAPEHDDDVRAALAQRYRTAFLELQPRSRPARAAVCGRGRPRSRPSGEREDVVLGIATGKSRRGVDRLFAREGWAGRFLTVQTADDHPSKPHPAMILAAMAEAGVGRRAHGHGGRHHLRRGDGALRPAWARWASPGATTRPRSCARRAPTASSRACDSLPAGIDDFFARQERAA